MSQLFYGKCIDLKFVPSNQSAWLTYLENNDKKSVWLEIDEDKPKRTLDQNALYWLYIGVIEKESGNLATDLHELFKRKFLPPIPKKIMGIEFKLPASTKDLTKQEMGEYLDKISAFTGVPIPVTEKEFDIPVAYPDNNLGELKF